jgi:ribonuclease P protein component
VDTAARLPRSARLLRRGEFLRVQNAGRRVNTQHFVVLVLRWEDRPVRTSDSHERSRLGVTAGKRVGGAVRRNRVKRLLREVYRQNKALFPADCDVVCVARPGADRLDYRAVQSELERAREALARAGRPQP